jgi:hydroxymethylbilane synthase
VTLKLATIPELHAEAGRAEASLRAAGHTVQTVTPTTPRDGRVHEAALESVRAGEADLAVVPFHCLASGGHAAAVLRRDEPGDVLVTRGPRAHKLSTLPPASPVGVAGARCKALLRAHRPDLEPVPMENGQSPPEAFAAGIVDAAVMGASQARQSGLEAHITEFQDNKAWLPAPQQGAVAVVAQNGARAVVQAALDHQPTRIAVACEGALASRLDAWHEALGAVALPAGPVMRLWAMLLSADGTRMVRGDLTGRSSDPEGLAALMADHLRARGADEVMGR